MDTPLLVAIVGVCGIGLGSYVTLLSTQKAAQKQIDAQTAENKARRDHEAVEAHKRRDYEARIEARKVHREAIARFRREYSRYSEHRDEDLAHNMRVLELSIRDAPIEEPKERREIMRELVYWTTLLPTEVQRAAQALLAAHQKDSYAMANLWASAWITAADTEDGVRPVSDAGETIFELRDAYRRFDRLATAWIEAHALADEPGVVA